MNRFQETVSRLSRGKKGGGMTKHIIIVLILVFGMAQGCSGKASPTEPSATTSTGTNTTSSGTDTAKSEPQAEPTSTPPAEQFAVTGVGSSVNPRSYAGRCPGVFNFVGGITVNTAGTVTYRWEWSDGGTSPTESLTFSSGGNLNKLSTSSPEWKLGANGTFWGRIHILTPNDMYGTTEVFTNNCWG